MAENMPDRIQEQDGEKAPLLQILVAWWTGYRRLVLIGLLLAGLSTFLALLPDAVRRSIQRGLGERRSLVAILFVFSLLTLSLLWAEGQRLDEIVFLYFNQHRLRGPVLDRLMWITTQIGSGMLSFSLAGLLYWQDFTRLAIEIVLGTFSLWLMVELIKALTDRARPFIRLSGAHVVGWRALGRSFPSGHTTQTFFLVTLLVHHFQLHWLPGVGLFLVAALVGFTRIYVGAHYPRDVVGGVLLGLFWGILGVIVDSYLSGVVAWQAHYIYERFPS